MKFLELQDDVVSLISARLSVITADLGYAVPTENVVGSIGFSSDYLNKKLSVDTALNATKPGCVVEVFPPAKGTSFNTPNLGGTAPLDVVVLVRLEFNPKQLQLIREKYEADLLADPDTTTVDAKVWMCQVIRETTRAILGVAPAPSGQRYQLHEEFFELINYDSGLIAFHLKFNRPCVL